MGIMCHYHSQAHKEYICSMYFLLTLLLAGYCLADYFHPNTTGLRLQHGFETLLIQPYGYDGFRVRAWPFRPPTGQEISFLYDPPLEGFENGTAHGMSYDLTSTGETPQTLRNGDLILRTTGWGGNAGGYRLSFSRVNADGSETLLTNEYAPLKSLNPRTYTWPGPGAEFRAEFSFSSTADEQFYGTGTQQDHRINKKGSVIDLVNFNTYIPTPIFVSNKGYAFVWNTPAEGRMELGTLRTRFVAESTTLVDYVIVTTADNSSSKYDTLQRRLSALTGRAPTPPAFSLGYIQSKLRYENQSEVELLAHNFAARNIPVSLIVIDYQSWAHQGDWALDPRLWPNVSHMATVVRNTTGAQMMASLWPSVADNSLNYAALQGQGLLSATRSGPGTTDSWNGSYIRNYDATNPRAREFLWAALHRNYYTQGIQNFWIDQADGGALGEAYENNGQSTYIQSIPYALPDVLYAAGTQRSVGKLYPWAHQQAIDEGFRNASATAPGSACPHISLSRSGYIGSQRWCSIIWSGDTTSVWETLAAQIASGLSAAATGGNIDTDEFRELYVRWFAWATFLPFMRTHGNRACNVQEAYTCANEPWSYGAENTRVLVGYIHLRYQLAQYLTQVFERFSREGRSIMRPLYMDFEHSDGNVTAWVGGNANFTTQQYMFGPRLLVSPVTKPNVSQWEVYLPATGEKGRWTNWWSNETYAGGEVVTVAAPREQIPLFYLGKREEILSGEVFA
ncbi:uncharacterized protein BP01DRAFT_426123 [Aspergillus saccharolyticus JOP 1030-1]|uniref:Alpha-glucosidase n=1 Tax=Aspergillus saccharolyticus JOP 1030-1 TaxID=1450539 RepID=A0A319A2U6_9EURO|nr:hypothetical protein BP01DRAFT_426123 [Aspergillus saccharolyticus JOP 1030-1]PYH41772.1 hypothetical protein BP01DRAFT_426123 [Aspergillus saccharolyticus JOP 1030-1]